MKKRTKIVILTSGGIDSSTMLLIYRTNFEIQPLFIDYGQIAAKQELIATKNICKHLKITKPKSISVDAIGTFNSNQLTNKRATNPWLPHRNLVLLTIAAMYAHSIRSRALAYGAVADSASRFPDCTPEFIRSVATTISYSADYNVMVYSPFSDLQKAEVISYGASQNFPYLLTYSCYKGEKIHCGKCQGCKHRRLAFKLAKVKDPTKYA